MTWGSDFEQINTRTRMAERCYWIQIRVLGFLARFEYRRWVACKDFVG